MKRTLCLLALLAAVCCGAVPALAQDGFYVVGGRYTPGIRITSLPYTITAPGYYYLTGNLSFSGSPDAIVVGSATTPVSNVTIDLMGFTLTGPSNSNGYGIYIYGNNVEVRNGTITGWYWAIFSSGYSNQRAIGVRAVGNTFGIPLGSNALIRGCTASQGSFAAGYRALWVHSGTIAGCTVMNYTQSEPDLSSLSIGSGGGSASDNLVINCAAIGIQGYGPATISHNAVINCGTGISNGGGGSIVGNAVLANAGQTGIAPATAGVTPSLLDQNSVKGDGTHYGPGNPAATVKGLNSP